MLVLSRRENESIVFANLGIQIDIVRVAGKVARLGIQAPRDVRVLRGELAVRDTPSLPADPPPPAQAGSRLSREERHALRNRLNKAMLGLQVLQASLDAGKTEDLESLTYKIFQNLQELNAELGGAARASAAASLPEGGADRPRALIVDDNANEAELLAQYLQLNGYDTQVVENGREAIGWLQTHEHPDVVLMDMNMPELDGAAAIHLIREDEELAEIRLFGVSGLDQEEAGVATGDHGVDQWFTKPVDARRLVEEIRRPLETRRA